MNVEVQADLSAPLRLSTCDACKSAVEFTYNVYDGKANVCELCYQNPNGSFSEHRIRNSLKQMEVRIREHINYNHKSICTYIEEKFKDDLKLTEEEKATIRKTRIQNELAKQHMNTNTQGTK